MSLKPVLQKIGAAQVMAGIYAVLPFVPSRRNPSGDPTRDEELRTAWKGLGLEGWTDEELYQLSQMKTMRRWASNWVRLVLQFLGPQLLKVADRSVFRVKLHEWHTSNDRHHLMEFDSTLGFPGEGPSTWFLGTLHHLCIAASLFCLSPCPSCLWIFCLFNGGVDLAEAMPMRPRNLGDETRAAARSDLGPLRSGRLVLQITQNRRDRLLFDFESWLEEQGLSADEIFSNAFQNIDQINQLLASFGRMQYNAGRPLNQFAETINAVSSVKPALRRSLQGAWDVAYTWARREPSVHHVAMPGQILLAMISVSLIWGWVRMAGALALGWGALLRPGEIFQARRADLYLKMVGTWLLMLCLAFQRQRHDSRLLDTKLLLWIFLIYWKWFI